MKKILILMAVVIIASLALIGCGAKSTEVPEVNPEGLIPLKIANIPVDDLLPLYAAQKAGVFEELGLDLTIEVFTSTPDMLAAVTSKAADGALIDPLVFAQLVEGGTGMKAITRAAPSYGGIVASAGSGITGPDQLGGVPVACTDASLTGYIVYKAATDAGVPAAKVGIENVPAVPVRVELVTSEKVKAAAIPWTFCGMAEAKGAKVIVDNKDIEPYIQTVIALSDEFLAKPGADATVSAVLEAWNRGCDLVNADPQSHVELLAEKLNLPAEVIPIYEVRTYEKAGNIDEKQLNDMYTWALWREFIKAGIPLDTFMYKP